MHDDARLVVRGSASIEAAVLLERLERSGEPFLRRSRWLDVVMRIKKDGRRPGRSGNLPEDGRVGARVLEQLHVSDTRRLRAARRCAPRTVAPVPVGSWEH